MKPKPILQIFVILGILIYLEQNDISVLDIVALNSRQIRIGAYVVGGIAAQMVLNGGGEFLHELSKAAYLAGRSLPTDKSLGGLDIGGLFGGGGGGGRTSERRAVTGVMKKKVAAGQGWKCRECGVVLDETQEVDHIRPLDQGGSNSEGNLQALCPHCHRKKSLHERQL